MGDVYCLEIGYREDLDEEKIEPYYIELRNLTNEGIDECILKWKKTKKKAVKFAKKYIKKHSNTQYFQFW